MCVISWGCGIVHGRSEKSFQIDLSPPPPLQFRPSDAHPLSWKPSISVLSPCSQLSPPCCPLSARWDTGGPWRSLPRELSRWEEQPSHPVCEPRAPVGVGSSSPVEAAVAVGVPSPDPAVSVAWVLHVVTVLGRHSSAGSGGG